MNKQEFERIIQSLGECVRHADALTADRRVHLEPGETQPLVLKKLHPKPSQCGDCDRDLPDRRYCSHSLKSQGWRSHCSSCNLVRQAGNDYWGQSQRAEAIKRLGVRPDLLVPEEETMPASCPELQLDTTESDSNEPLVLGFEHLVVVKEYPESVIKEFRRIPIYAPADQSGAPEPGSEVHKD